MHMQKCSPTVTHTHTHIHTCTHGTKTQKYQDKWIKFLHNMNEKQ